ncbi:hypothetical protein BH11GEM2_BH11GEM2_31640 [soil metagenome]
MAAKKRPAKKDTKQKPPKEQAASKPSSDPNVAAFDIVARLTQVPGKRS